MHKPESNILSVVREMCLYWNIRPDHQKKTLLQFRKMIRNVSTCPIGSVTPEQLLGLFHRLRAESTGSDESVKRKFEYVKRVFKYAHARGYITQNPCLLLKLPKSRRAPIIHLCGPELKRLEQLRVCGNLQRVKDWFLFQCYTGLSYTDFALFNKSCVQSIQGKYYLYGARTKTGTEYIVPFTDAALKIAERYRYRFSSNCINTYNRELKQLQQLAAIETRLTTHVARRTFGQMMIDRGVALEVVSKMLGHSATSMTERYYARVGMSRVIQDVAYLAAA
ncbi:MAG: integrase catalytic domain-containing protein [Chitinophagales bacterium]|nr:integrase catalytic domain-containing protein [Chitinophagales bacterium]